MARPRSSWPLIFCIVTKNINLFNTFVWYMRLVNFLVIFFGLDSYWGAIIHQELPSAGIVGPNKSVGLHHVVANSLKMVRLQLVLKLG
jgi:hypothetical protein